MRGTGASGRGRTGRGRASGSQLRDVSHAQNRVLLDDRFHRTSGPRQRVKRNVGLALHDRRERSAWYRMVDERTRSGLRADLPSPVLPGSGSGGRRGFVLGLSALRLPLSTRRPRCTLPRRPRRDQGQRSCLPLSRCSSACQGCAHRCPPLSAMVLFAARGQRRFRDLVRMVAGGHVVDLARDAFELRPHVDDERRLVF